MLPSLAIGIGAFGAGSLVFQSSKKNSLSNNKSLYEIISEAKEINKQIKLMAKQIEDREIVKYILEINNTVDKIIDTVEKNPSKLKNIDNFFDYYLPVTIKMLNKYDEIENQKISSAESKKFMVSSKNMIIKIDSAFKKQLASLYQSDILDSDAEMKVFESMLKSDGYDDNDFNV